MWALLGLIAIISIGLLLAATRYPVTDYMVGLAVIVSILVGGIIAAGYWLSIKKEYFAYVTLILGAIFWLMARIMKVNYYTTTPWQIIGALGIGIMFVGIVVLARGFIKGD